MALPEEAWEGEKGRGTGAGTTSFTQALWANDKQLMRGAGWDGNWKEDSTNVSSTKRGEKVCGESHQLASRDLIREDWRGIMLGNYYLVECCWLAG